jgi:hypothetical protein
MRSAVWEGEARGDSGRGTARRGRRGGPRAGAAGAGHRVRACVSPGRRFDADHARRRSGRSDRGERDRGPAREPGPARRGTGRGLGAPGPVPGPAGRGGHRPGPAGRRVRGRGRSHGDGPGARAGRVAGRIGAGVRRRRAAQVRRSGRTGGILPPGRRGAAAARQRGPHPGRRSRARRGQDVAARGRLRRLPGGAGRIRGRVRSQPGHHAVGRRDRVMARRQRRAAPPPLGAPAEGAGLGRTGICRAGAGRRTGPGPARRPSASTSSTGYATGPARRT